MNKTLNERVEALCFAYFPSCVANAPTTAKIDENKEVLTIIQPLKSREARVLKISLKGLLIIDSLIVIDGSDSYRDQQLNVLISFQRSLTYTEIGNLLVDNCNEAVYLEAINAMTNSI